MMTLHSMIRRLFFFTASLGLALAIQAQELKIGYVNSERVLNETTHAKTALNKLKLEFERRERDLRDSASKLQAAGEKLEKDSLLMSESERSRRQRELVETERDLVRKRRELQEDFQQRRNEEHQVVIERANKVIKQIFDAEKYDLIVQDALHASSRIDITKRVIDAMNTQK
jgi:outer membrane protein